MAGKREATADVFVHEEHGAWDVSKARRACEAGIYGPPLELPLGPAIHHSGRIEVDPVRIERIKGEPETLAKPAIAVMWKGRGLLIDGNHRIRALAELGRETFACWTIPREAAPKYKLKATVERRNR